MTTRWPAGMGATYLIPRSPHEWSPRVTKGRAAAARLSAALAGRREITVEPFEGVVRPGDQATDDPYCALAYPKVFVAPEECGKIAELGLILRVFYRADLAEWVDWYWHNVWIMKDGSLSCLRLIREVPGTISAPIIAWMAQDAFKNA